MGVRTTRQADQDIIGLYLRGAAEFGITQAELYHEGLLATFAMLADNPRMARERTKLRPPMRLHPWQSHLIAYVVEGDDILIIRVLHGRQDWEQLL